MDGLVHTGSYSADNRMPTTPALTPAIADCTGSRCRSSSQNGNAATNSLLAHATALGPLLSP